MEATVSSILQIHMLKHGFIPSSPHSFRSGSHNFVDRMHAARLFREQLGFFGLCVLLFMFSLSLYCSVT